MRISDWSSDVCSSDLLGAGRALRIGCGAERATQLVILHQQQGAAQCLGKVERSLLGIEVMGVALASAQHHRREGLVAVAPVMKQSRGDALQVRHAGKHTVSADTHRPSLLVAIKKKAPQARKALTRPPAVCAGVWP